MGRLSVTRTNPKAGVSTTDARSSIDVQNIKTSIDYVVAEASTNYQYLQLGTTYQNPALSLEYVYINASVLMDYDTRNRYFRDGHTYTMQDVIALSASKVFTDILYASDDTVLTVGKSLSDAITLSEVIDILTIYQRSFDETVTVTDVLEYSIHFYRSFQDFFALDDFTAFGISKTNVFVIDDELAIAYSKPFADGYSVGDQSAILTGKNVADSVAFNDNMVYIFHSDESSVLNTSVLNGFALNS